jgi:hypothetical protein
MSDNTEKQISPDDRHDASIAEATPVEEDGVAPIIHPGDHRNPSDPRLPLVSPIVDGGNL